MTMTSVSAGRESFDLLVNDMERDVGDVSLIDGLE